MAALTNLVTSFVRRITKYYESGSFSWGRPKAAPAGTNHIDNASDFDAKTIYRGEEILDVESGKFYTQDGAEIVQPNTPPAILEGLRLTQQTASGGGPLWISLSDGYGRVTGRNYYYESASVNGDVELSINAIGKARVDLIYLQSDYPNPAPAIFGATAGNSTEYAGKIVVVEGYYYNKGRAVTLLADGTAGNSFISLNSLQVFGTGTFALGDRRLYQYRSSERNIRYSNEREAS